MKPRFSVHRTTKQSGDSLPQHSHEEGQLTFAASGIVQIYTDAGVWVVPPLLAAWIPAGVRHRLEILTEAELWMVHCDPGTLRA